MIAPAATAELGAKVGALKLIELPDLSPGCVADRTRDIDF
jgi:hypothetical protein